MSYGDAGRPSATQRRHADAAAANGRHHRKQQPPPPPAADRDAAQPRWQRRALLATVALMVVIAVHPASHRRGAAVHQRLARRHLVDAAAPAGSPPKGGKPSTLPSAAAVAAAAAAAEQVGPTGDAAVAASAALRAGGLADREDAQHANDPPPYRDAVANYTLPSGKFQPLIVRDSVRRQRSLALQARLLRHYPMGAVALCLAVKDQGRDMPEWLAWHRTLGIGRVYMFDMGSRPPMNQTLQPYMDDGLLEYHWVDKNRMGVKGKGMPPQLQIYDICVNEFKHRHAWMGFIDADEFLVLRNRKQKLPAFLKAYQRHGALAVNWVVFGSSGHKTRPRDGVMRSYWKCLNTTSLHSRHVKMLVNTQYVDRPWRDPHTFTYKDSKRAVNERGAFVDVPIHPYHTSEKISIHHYVLKSLEEYKEKMKRGSAMLNNKPLSYFDSIDKQAALECWDGIHAADELDFVAPLVPAPAALAAAELEAAPEGAADAADPELEGSGSGPGHPQPQPKHLEQSAEQRASDSEQAEAQPDGKEAARMAGAEQTAPEEAPSAQREEGSRAQREASRRQKRQAVVAAAADDAPSAAAETGDDISGPGSPLQEAAQMQASEDDTSGPVSLPQDSGSGSTSSGRAGSGSKASSGDRAGSSVRRRGSSSSGGRSSSKESRGGGGNGSSGNEGGSSNSINSDGGAAADAGGEDVTGPVSLAQDAVAADVTGATAGSQDGSDAAEDDTSGPIALATSSHDEPDEAE